MAPKNYYQILNIWVYIKNKKQYLPLFHILLTSKNQIIYNHIFRFIKQILIDNSIECDFSEKIITRDFEKSLRKSIAEVLKPKFLNSCNFSCFKGHLEKKQRIFFNN